MILRWVIAVMLPLTWACADDEPAQEPVKTDTAAAVPDAPGGDAGGDLGASPAGGLAGDMGGAAGVGGDQGAAGAAAGAGGDAAPAPAVAGGAVGGGNNMVVTVGGLNVRNGPGMKHKVVRVLKKGTTVSVVSCSGNWCKLGEQEYASKKYLSDKM